MGQWRSVQQLKEFVKSHSPLVAHALAQPHFTADESGCNSMSSPATPDTTDDSAPDCEHERVCRSILAKSARGIQKAAIEPPAKMSKSISHAKRTPEQEAAKKEAKAVKRSKKKERKSKSNDMKRAAEELEMRDVEMDKACFEEQLVDGLAIEQCAYVKAAEDAAMQGVM